MHLDGQTLTLPDHFSDLARSIVQDLGAIPPDYLQAAGPGAYPADREADGAPASHRNGADVEEGAWRYDEWDHKRNDYRKNWCVLRQQTLTEGEGAFVADTLAKHAGILHHIRRSFELFRDGDRRVRRQERGDELDLDALVAARVAALHGEEMDGRVHERMDRVERDVATLILVDLSGSTKGWVNDAIRESVLLLTRGLEILGDRFAIHGFTGMTRKRCELHTAKTFEESPGSTIHRRIAAMVPKEYTRMGVFIRHARELLLAQAAKTRLLIVLSDGKPEDYDSFQDGYRGPYGLADTRMALVEARNAGIHPFCITIDREARDYLPKLYGPSRYVVIDSARDLPRKITDIYRRLTA